MRKKINDDLALRYYFQGYSDSQIAKKFRMVKSSIFNWRKRNGLPSFNPRTNGEPNLTSEELLKGYALVLKNHEKWRQRNLERVHSCGREYIKKYRESPKIIERERRYGKEYYNKNKDKINKRLRERYVNDENYRNKKLISSRKHREKKNGRNA